MKSMNEQQKMAKNIEEAKKLMTVVDDVIAEISDNHTIWTMFPKTQQSLIKALQDAKTELYAYTNDLGDNDG